MAQERLVLDGWRGTFRICWLIVDDGEEGAHLGDYLDGSCPAPDKNSEHYIATEAARVVGAEFDSIGLYWHSNAAASKALAAAKAALTIHRSAKPWPEWAKQALAAGWKAPKGWKP